MNYKKAWGNLQAFFMPKTGQNRGILGVLLPHGLPQDFKFPPKKVIEKTKNKGADQTMSAPL